MPSAPQVALARRRPASTSSKSLPKGLARPHPKDDYGWSPPFLETLRLRVSLLIERKGRLFSFPHRTFQEYLASVHLARRPNFGREAAALSEQGTFWREVILPAVGYLVDDKRETEKPRNLVRALSRRRRGLEKGLAGRGRAAGGGRPARPRRGGGRVAVPRRGAEAGAWSTSWSRVPCSPATGPRPGPTCWASSATLASTPVVSTFHVLTGASRSRWQASSRSPLGPFVMGSRQGDDQASPDEMGNPERREFLTDTWIGRYPVTVRQFEAFVEAGGYADETWWTALGWEWRHGRWDSRPEAEALRDWLRSRPAELRGAPMGGGRAEALREPPRHRRLLVRGHGLLRMARRAATGFRPTRVSHARRPPDPACPPRPSGRRPPAMPTPAPSPGKTPTGTRRGPIPTIAGLGTPPPSTCTPRRDAGGAPGCSGQRLGVDPERLSRVPLHPARKVRGGLGALVARGARRFLERRPLVRALCVPVLESSRLLRRSLLGFRVVSVPGGFCILSFWLLIRREDAEGRASRASLLPRGSPLTRT